jgi:NADH:ubiquinone oxidoreductase subunit 6 (subunit J)
MGVREKNAWAMLVIAIAGVAVYLTLLVISLDGVSPTDVRYQPLMLWTIGLGIAAAIVVHITLSIRAGLAGESQDADERDRAIERFGTNVGQAFLVIGGLAGLLMALAEWEWFWIANALYFGFALSAILECVAEVVAYRRGLPW